VKRLTLLRHAKSDWDDMTLRDFDRTLNDRGRRGAEAIGAHVRRIGWTCDAALASPAARVKRTIEGTGIDVRPSYDDRLYLADATTLLAAIREVPGDPDSLLVAGHNPGLQELVFELVDPAEESALLAEAASKFPTAAMAVLELAIDRWADIAPGCGRLVLFARPRDLDPELGPELGPERVR